MIRQSVLEKNTKQDDDVIYTSTDEVVYGNSDAMMFKNTGDVNTGYIIT